MDGTQVFHRKWRFYFSYCEAAFAAQYIYDYQVQ
jgi:cyclopropane fatty-acyl-phospholipid synthase-like methyltransferase